MKQGTKRHGLPVRKQRLLPRTLFLDIETAPLEVYTWGLWKQNIGLNQINVDFTILSFSASWDDEETVHHFNTGGRGRAKVRDDRNLCEILWHLLDEADFVVVQNGKKFDLPKINARMLDYKLPPYSPVKIIDTLLIAKKHFGFTSNKLQYMTEKYCTVKKRQHEKFPGFELWVEMLKDNAEAWVECRLYNDDDVRSMRELYFLVRPWMEGHPSVAAYTTSEKVQCPKCGSHQVAKRGFSFTQTGKYQRYQCNSCGGWSRSRYTLNTLGKRKALLSN